MKTMLVPRSRVLAFLLGAVLCAGAVAAAQTPPAGRPRAKKVWTEEDLMGLRTPADRYERRQAQKAEAERISREAEEASRKDAATRAQPTEPSGTASTPEAVKPDAVAPATPSADSIPTRLEDVQKRIEVVRQQVADLELEARKRLGDLNTAREDQKAAASTRNADANARLDKARVELQLLEAKLQELKPAGN